MRNWETICISKNVFSNFKFCVRCPLLVVCQFVCCVASLTIGIGTWVLAFALQQCLELRASNELNVSPLAWLWCSLATKVSVSATLFGLLTTTDCDAERWSQSLQHCLFQPAKCMKTKRVWPPPFPLFVKLPWTPSLHCLPLRRVNPRATQQLTLQ